MLLHAVSGVTLCVVSLLVLTSFTFFWAAKLVQTERKCKFRRAKVVKKFIFLLLSEDEIQ